MERLDEIKALQLDALPREKLSDLSVACRHLRKNKNLEAKRILGKLLSHSLPPPVRSIVDSLNKAASGYLHIIAAEDEAVHATDRTQSALGNSYKVKQAIDLVLVYEQHMVELAKQQWKDEQQRLREQEALAQAQRDEEERQAELARKAKQQEIESLLCFTERGIRIHWQKSDSALSSLLGDHFLPSEVQETRKSLATEWLSAYRFRIPTEEQLEFIIDTHHSIRVTARAGSGKTETVATKILFLLHFIGLSAQHILALVFNTEARDDLIKRITDLEENAGLTTKGPYSVMNFDRLARGVVQPQASILKGAELSKKIQELVHFFLSGQSENADLIKQVMLASFQADWDKWLRNNERYSPAQLDQLRSLLNEESIDGRSVKSKGEKRIADFFFEHNIDYQYEYPWRTDRGVVIYPDFYLPQYRVVIEFLGLNGDKDYDEATAFKRRYWEGKPGYKLIEIYPKDLEGLSPDFVQGREQDYATLQTRIKEALLEQGCGDIELLRLTDEEILEKLKKRIRFEFEKLLTTVLTRLGQCCQTNADVMSLVSSFQASNEAEQQFIQLLPIIDQAYRDLLQSNHATDFAQLKWDCIRLLKQGQQSFAVERGTVRVFPERLRYIFIDEFQDFSDLYQEIVQALLLHSNDGVVNAVGDDWQMINRFAGSDLSLFHGFSAAFPRPRELTLTTNFRSCAQIVDFCNAVMEGQGAPARTADHLQDKAGRVAEVCLNSLQLTDAEEHYFKSDPTLSSLLRLIPACSRGLKLEEQVAIAESTDQGVDALKPFFYILTRTNFPQGLKVGSDHFSFIKSASGRGLKFLDEFLTSTHKNDLYPTAVRALTAHRSKGKEAEVVFVLAPEQYPLIHPSSSFLAIFGDDIGSIIDDERRLFYVACSRARQWLFLLTFAPNKQPEYVPKQLLETFHWREAPYVRKIPDGLYRVEVKNLSGERNALYNNTERLKELGFSYTAESGIPTRWQHLECGLEDVAKYVVERLSEFGSERLHWSLFDAAGGLCFQWPGPVEPSAFLQSCVSTPSQTSAPRSEAVPINREVDVFVDPLCRAIYDYFTNPSHGLQALQPEPGFELAESGSVVAQAELAWPQHRTAVVLSEDDYEQFLDRNWRVWLASSETDEQADHLELVDLPSVVTHLKRCLRAEQSANPHQPAQLQELEYVHESCLVAAREAIQRLGCSPQVGYELLASGEGIVAEAELAWPDQQCAVVLTYDDYDAFQDDGWDVWLAGQPADRAIDGYALLDPQELLKALSSHPVQT